MSDEPNEKPIDLSAEDKYWQEHHESQPHAAEGTTYEHFAPAYGVGAEAAGKYPGKEFHEIEDDIALDYEKHEVGSALGPGSGCLESCLVESERIEFASRSVPRHARRHLRIVSLAPLVLRILPLQLGFDLGITLAPEGGEIVGDLDRAVIGRQHFDA